MKKPSINIVIPVYNEEKVIESSIKNLYDFLKEHFGYNWKIIIADNASTDKTSEKAKILSKKYKNVFYTYIDKKGRGYALKKAWTENDADIHMYMDVDLSTDLEAFPRLIDSILEGNDVVIGSRFEKESKLKRSIKREILSKVYNLIVRFALNVKFKDAQCGFKAVTREIAEKIVPQIKDMAWFFDTELLFLTEKNGYKIKEIPVAWIEDPDTKVRIYFTVINYLKNIIRLRKYKF